MLSDSIVNGSAPAISKDIGKKKRNNNRTAKLKQYKLDARREQWLSQVKDKGCKEESNGRGVSPPSSLHQSDEQKGSLENLETRSGVDNEGPCINDSDLESLANSPTRSILGVNDSRKDRPGSSSSSFRSSSSSGCYSGSVSEEEEDDACLDDWEAVADALTADDKRHQPNSAPRTEPQAHVGSIGTHELPSKTWGAENLKPDCQGTVSRVAVNGRAWRPDDAFRPQSLPNLSKQRSFTVNAERHCGRGAVTWACHIYAFCGNGPEVMSLPCMMQSAEHWSIGNMMFVSSQISCCCPLHCGKSPTFGLSLKLIRIVVPI
ncbi:hypothetical protein NE237_006168 [Protea cynaroides]|uniref:Uncharacterized protein n=1 Tax=Protea cynaroides TaxID=273540 RepID=A0A9Q0KM36_9MAGN|nr:hypothetical protein NE237_006168 [Protea cynaroides]